VVGLRPWPAASKTTAFTDLDRSKTPSRSMREGQAWGCSRCEFQMWRRRRRCLKRPSLSVVRSPPPLPRPHRGGGSACSGHPTPEAGSFLSPWRRACFGVRPGQGPACRPRSGGPRAGLDAAEPRSSTSSMGLRKDQLSVADDTRADHPPGSSSRRRAPLVFRNFGVTIMVPIGGKYSEETNNFRHADGPIESRCRPVLPNEFCGLWPPT
jgi:hypothetical protein